MAIDDLSRHAIGLKVLAGAGAQIDTTPTSTVTAPSRSSGNAYSIEPPQLKSR